MKINGKEVSYKDSLKSMDTEETIDLMFYRPIGFAWAVLLPSSASNRTLSPSLPFFLE